MATTLFLVTTAGPANADTTHDLALSTSRGSGNATRSVDTTASGNHIPFGDLLANGTTAWGIQVDAVTISGTITFNFWAVESAMTVNAQMACRVARYDSSGVFVSDIVANANANHADGVELGTSLAARSWTATPTSTALSSGDILAVIPHADAIGTMAAASTGVQISIGGTTPGATADSFVTFTETITAFTPPVDRVPCSSPYPQILAQ